MTCFEHTYIHTFCSDYQGLTLISLLTPTVDTTHCDVVLIAFHKTKQFTLCDTASGDVQKSIIWSLGSVGSDVDEVEISNVSITQCPAQSHIHCFTDRFRNVMKVKGGDGGGPGENA